MCVAYPARVVSLDDNIAVVEASGRLQRIILLSLEGDLPAPGDWLLVQSGLALTRLTEEQAHERTP